MGRGLPLLAAAAFAAAATCPAANEVVVISPHWDGIKHETARAFDAWHRERYNEPATVRWREIGGGTSAIIQFLKSEFQQRPGGIGIDIMYGGGVDPFLDLKDAGLLQRWDPPAPILDAIPPRIGGFPVYDPGRQWFGAALSGFGILTNERIRALLKLPVAREWADLARPELQGWISAGDPRQSGSVLTMYEIILQAYGWDRGWRILAGISGNNRAFLTNGAGPPKEAALGEVAYALAIDVYGWTQVGHVGADAMTFILPEGVTAINPDAIALLKNPANPETASRFLEFVLSPAGQSLWMLPRGKPGGSTRYDINRFGVIPALYTSLAGITPIRTNPFQGRFDFQYDPKKGAARRSILAGLLGAVFIDIHPEVKRAWNAILASPQPGPGIEAFTTPPLGEEELFRLASTDWKRPDLKTALLNRWQRDALKRLAELRQSNAPGAN